MKISNLIALPLAALFVACQSNGTTSQAGSDNPQSPKVVVYSAPVNEVLNHDYRVVVDGQEVPVYNKRVSLNHSKKQVNEEPGTYENAGFAYFDLIEGEVEVQVSYKTNIRSVSFIAAGKKPIPEFRDNVLKFTVSEPQNLSVVINDDAVHTLDLFINPELKDVPDVKDPKVVYFAPGSYRLPAATLEDGMTIYVAGGAVVHCYVGPHEWYTVNEETGLKNYSPFYMFNLDGKHIRVCGRGIIDADGTPLGSRRGIRINGEDISIEGVILRNSSECAIYVDSVKQAKIDNVKILNYRFNADGLNITPAASDVVISNSFVQAITHIEDQSDKAVLKDNVLFNSLNTKY